MMGEVVAKNFPECFEFNEQEMNRIIACAFSLNKKKSGKNKMDATCTIQYSIHVFNLVHKYVSRILGTYQIKLYLKETFITKIIT